MDKTKFQNLINNLSTIALKNKWIPLYNKELDYFFWTQKNVSGEAKLVKVSHETSLYINPRKEIEGIFVEYLRTNFVEHNPLYGVLLKQFTKKIDNNVFTVANINKAEKYFIGMAEALRADIYQDAQSVQEKGINFDFDNLIKCALAVK